MQERNLIYEALQHKEAIKVYNKKRRKLERQVESLNKKIEKKKRHWHEWKAIEELIIDISAKTQNKFKKGVEKLVSLGLGGVFDREYGFELEYLQRANRVDCQPWIVGDGGKQLPREMGASMFDISGLFSRISLIEMEEERKRLILLLDEPFKFLGEFTSLACQILKEIQRELGIQIIITTHDERIMEIGDLIYEVKHDGKESIITEKKAWRRKRKKRKLVG